MYLFKRANSKNLSGISFNLHSTMYLFKLDPAARPSYCKIYLHSTMYLFKRLVFRQRQRGRSNLHSTMYLFKLNSKPTNLCPVFIYIPPCIYLNAFASPAFQSLSEIYIPPCIYLNPCFLTTLHSTCNTP